MGEPLADFTVGVFGRLADAEARAIEQQIRILLKPRPRWWPQWFYDRMVRRLLEIEYASPLRRR